MKIRVIFKKFRDGEREVIAFFPGTYGSHEVNRYNILSYMHMGQHAEASIDCYRRCVPASEEEYAKLLAELKSIYRGDEIVVRKRMSANNFRHHDWR